MKSRNRADLHVVKAKSDPMDEIIDKIMDELRDEEVSMEEIEAKVAEHKRKVRIRAMLIAAVIIAAAIGVYLLLTLQTYDQARVLNTLQMEDLNNGNYIQFSKGVIKYSRDGVVYLNQKGEEVWNHPCQIKDPAACVTDSSAAVYDKGGNTILVFTENGLKGEIGTTLPIQKVCVSDQGIAAAILKDENAPRVNCYDAQGNVLVEHKASASGTGYPLDVALSPDGNLLLVTYLYVQDASVKTKIAYFNFGEVGQDETDHKVTEAEYDNTIMPMALFMDQSTSVVIGEDSFAIYAGDQIPELVQSIELKSTIKSAFCNEKYIGFVLRNDGQQGYELRLYNKSGKEAMSSGFKGEYDHVKISGSKVIMYGDKRCSVFTTSGRLRFAGEMDAEIAEIFPIGGFNKYLVMSANGMEEVRFVK